MVARHDLAVLVEVRNVAERLVAEPVPPEHPAPRSRVALAIDATRAVWLPVFRERLIVEHEDGVFVHPCAHRGERPGVVHGREIDGARLRHEIRMKLAKGEVHGWSLGLSVRSVNPRPRYTAPGTFGAITVGTASQRLLTTSHRRTPCR